MSMNSHPVSRLRAAKGLAREAERSFAALRMTAALARPRFVPRWEAARCFAALRMTGLDLAGGEELSRAFEPCLKTQSVDHAIWASGE